MAWLSDLFSGGQVNHTGAQVQQSQAAPTNAGAAQVNRHIQSLTPGQTIQGEVVGRNGGEVQIKVSDDMVLNARIDQNMQLELGKTMTFEVRNNGRALTLSPLFANTAADANVLKALDMASLPVNQTTVSMTGLMMEAGLPIDRNSLMQMFREVNSFQGVNVSDLVDLHKLGLPVNEENLAQIASYKNLTHQLVDGMHTVLDALPEAMQTMVQEGNVEGAARMFQELLQLVQELPGAEEGTQGQPLPGGVAADGADAAVSDRSQSVGTLSGEVQNGRIVSGEGGQNVLAEAGKIIITETAAQIADANSEALLSMVGGKGASAAGGPENMAGNAVPANLQGMALAEGKTAVSGEAAGLPDAESGTAGENAGGTALSREFLQLIRENGGDVEKYSVLLRQLNTAAQNGDLGEQANALQRILQQGIADKNQPLLRGLIENRSAQNLLREGLSRLWTIEPKDVADSGKVDELYQRLDRQLKSLNHMLEQGGQTGTQAFKAVNNMSQNLDFLQQLNQAYTYVQLPLRLQQGDAHGDLYVYTNKRSLAAKDGQISALLHLDMEHLGPVDVYVAMQAEKVNTRFYVQDDAMLDFLEEHMDLLTQRLQKRGYNCSFAMQVRGREEEPESGLNGLTAQEKGRSIVQYAFDMRA